MAVDVGKSVTSRSILVGLLGVTIICAVEPYNSLYARGTHLVDSYFPIGAFFIILLIVLANVVLRKLKPGSEFTVAELIVIWCMMIVIEAIPYSGLVRYLFPALVAPTYFATPENEWQTLFGPHLSDWVVPKDGHAVKYFYEGLPSGQPVPWGAWLKPLIAWSAFALVIYFVMFCLCVILRKQWVERERLSFALAQLPAEMAQSDLRVNLLSSKVMWLSAILPVGLHTLNGLHGYFPAVPRIPLYPGYSLRFAEKPWAVLNGIEFSIFFTIIGFAYLIPTEVSFSIWFFYLFYKVQGVALNTLGVSIGETTAAYRQGMGAYLVMIVYIFWLGKEHLTDVFHKAFHPKSDVDDSDEPIPYRWAVLGAISGMAVATVMCNAVGISLWVSIVILLAFFTIVTVLSWLISSAGLIFAEQMFLPSEYIQAIAGSSPINPSGWTMLAIQGAITHDMLAIMMPNIMNSFKLSDYGMLKRRSLTAAIAIAIPVGLLVSYYSYFRVTYHYGGLNLEHYCYISASQNFFHRSASAIQYSTNTNFLELFFMLAGAGFMGFMLFMRYRFIWWPLHPAGYLMHLTWIAGVVWFSFFIGWIAKHFVLKYGGVGEYRRLRPVFLGAVIGESLIGCIWVIVNMFARVGYSILPL
ncbi:DUF6785 family protein [Candidatus Poribacteria bacterium]